MEQKNHRIVCENRKNIELLGIEKVESNNPSQVVCVAMGSVLVISGKNLHIKKLDINEGILVLEGTIDGIKYQGEKKSLLKRIFK